MRSISPLASALFISASLLIPAMAAKPVTRAVTKRPPPPPDYFPVGKDYWWKYQTTASTGDSGFEIKIENIEKRPDNTYIYDFHTTTQMPNVTTSTNFDEWYVKEKGTVMALKFAFAGKESEYQPPRKYILNPMQLGDTWIWEGTRMAGLNTTENNKCEGPELVEVPAGKFNAMKVTTEIVQGGQPCSKTYWYAPWVGLVQSKTQSGPVTSTSQLVKYIFPKPDRDKDKDKN